MELFIQVLNYGLVAAFGIALSAEFVGATRQRCAFVKLTAFTAVSLLVQGLCLWAFGLDATYKLYPLIVHVPLIAFLTVAFRQSPLNAAVSVLSAYLCCQVPHWFAEAAFLISGDTLVRSLAHITAIVVSYILLHRFAVGPMQKLLLRSHRSAVFLGVFPLLYYLFDYSTTVYSDLLYTGNTFAVQFAPSLLACTYFFFLLVYHAKVEEHEAFRREQELLSLQLRQSEAEYAALRRMQDQARAYRHDLRHHLSLLLGFAEENDTEKIKQYVCSIEEDLDTFTAKRYCRNDVIDLLLSHFDNRARTANITLSIEANLPETLPFSDVDICALLSNGLENALVATEQVSDLSHRTVTVKLGLKQKNFLMSIQNPFAGSVDFEGGLPATNREGHGIGVRSMAAIANRNGGHISFTTEGSVFTLRAMLPTGDNAPRACNA